MISANEFVFNGFSLIKNGFQLHYKLGALEFNETYTSEFFTKEILLKLSSSETLKKNLEYLSLAAGVSYFKLQPFSQIQLQHTKLNKAESEFFTKLYQNGLAEFAYRNGIDIRQACQFPFEFTTTSAKKTLAKKSLQQQKALVLIGGGKDSLVSVEALKKSGKKQLLFAVNPAKPILDCVETSKLPFVFVKRQLDTKLFELNEQGALNGHVPITAIISMLAVIVAQLSGCDSVITSNERSANEPTLIEGNWKVNHQYSKSHEFEQDFTEIINAIDAVQIQYFSILRAYSEYKIVERFLTFNLYDEVFTSCNRAFKLFHEKSKKRWCLECPKCHFVFLMFAAHCNDTTRIIKIFGGNPLNEFDNLNSFRQLVGLTNGKPWECVGEKFESAVALYQISDKNDYADNPIIANILPEIINLYGLEKLRKGAQKLLTLSAEHNIPDEYYECLNNE
ncbi:hypothetical protein [Catenovulum sediminis]|uniref:UDP-N-acetyl-alpha-D-muramoyl-L-alanyl-L-glutamate epimerase n=1 Tax=Catenovulum sediminis TaxID=1740262 RepID=A0ABV1RBW5_9ALTE|nr:hypothetical protein [Catenovulum sediminis]